MADTGDLSRADGAGSEFKYRAFISYSHRDTGWATWLHKSIENYRPPRHLVGQQGLHGPIPKRLAPVFRDREELPSATNLGGVISRALADSACQIVICSPDAARSKWVNEEILAFKRLGREDRIFCVIIGGEPNAADRAEPGFEECFPEALKFKLDAAGQLSSERTEPVAADARPGKDGRANARLKLIAGMLGVGFDALRQRELHRRQRRLAAVATAATLGMVVTTGLAAMALFARAEAERQRTVAEAEAETALRTAAFMIDLFRVSDPSEARGNSITAREILDRGARRLETELAGQPAVQASLMDTVGNVYSNLGLLDQARPLLESALRRRRDILGSNHPDTAATQASLGNWLRLDSEYGEAERAYREALAAQRLALGNQDPAVAASLAGLAEVLSEAGRYMEAEAALREALAIRRAAHGEEHADVGRALEDLALTLGQQGDLDAAIPMMEDALAMQRRIWGVQPHPLLAEALNNLGILLYAQGDYERTEALFRESLAMNRLLLGERHYDLAASINNLALVLHDQDDYVQAEAMYREVLAIQAESSGADTPAYANALNNLAYVLYDQGEERAAIESAQAAAAIYAESFPDGHPDYAATLAGIGAWRLELGEYAEAGTAIRMGLEMRERLLGREHPDFANSQVQLAMLLVADGQFDQALEPLREAQSILAAGLPSGHWRSAVAAAVEGAALAGLHEYTEAEPLLRGAFGVLERDPGALLVYVRATQRYLFDLYSAWGRPQDAAAYSDALSATNLP